MSCIHRGSVFVFLCSRGYHFVVIGAKQYDNELAGAKFPTTLAAATGPKKCPLSRVVYCRRATTPAVNSHHRPASPAKTELTGCFTDVF